LLNSPALFQLTSLGCAAMVVLLGLSLRFELSNAFAANQIPAAKNQHEIPLEFDPVNIDLKIKEIKKRLAEALAGENERTARQLVVTLSQLQERTAKLRDLETIYQRLITALNKRIVLEKEETFLREKLENMQQSGIQQNPPYSLSFYDNILDQLVTADHKKETAVLETSLVEKTLEDATLRLDESRQNLRKLKEDKESEAKRSEDPKLNWELDQAQLELETAQAISDVYKVVKKNLSIEVRLATQRVDVARQNIAWVRQHLYFDQADLKKQLDNLEKTRRELQIRLKNQLRGQIKVETAWTQAQQRATNAKKDTEIVLARAVLEATEARREASQRLLEQTEDMLQLLNQQEQAWKNRYALINDKTQIEQLDIWRKDFETYKEKNERTVRLQDSFQTSLHAQITALEKQASEQRLKTGLRREMINRLQALNKLADGGREYLSMLQTTIQLHQRLLDEISARYKEVDLWKTFTFLAGKLQDVWNLELWVIDEHGVTVKKLVIALAFLIIGLTLIKRIFLLMTRRLLARTKLQETTASAVGKIIHYIAILLIVLFALHVVNIPLTLFAFLGGAVAIGVGFGAQNLINNFISSFIIMAEQPIKIGDLIDIEGNFAMVEEIGARCTRIRTSGNVHILVPNSSFLEKNIINWTLADKEIRAQVTVGVIYGSPVREVERIMLKVAKEHTKVIKRPEPFVLFKDFGDNSLIFNLYFWISMTRLMDRLIIESDIRFHIDELFREAGIVIAFPQRDIHLDTKSPLEFSIVNTGDKSERIEKK
jgi:small-conductance mechanosensitive channel